MAVLPPDPIFRFKAEMGYLHCLCFVENHFNSMPDDNIDEAKSNGPKLLMAAGENGIVYVWDLERNRLKFKQQLGNSIQALHSYKSSVIVQEKEGVITIYRPKEPQANIHQYEEVMSIPCCAGFCKSIRFASDKLLLPQDNATIHIFDLESRTTIKRINITSSPAALGYMMCIEDATINHQQYIFAGFETGDVFAWNYESGEQVSHAKFQECLISFTLDGWSMRGVCGGNGNTLQVFTIDKQLNMEVKCEVALTNEGCQIVRVRPDRKVLVCGGFDGRVRIYSWKTLRLLAVLSEHRASITDIAFTAEVVDYWASRIMAVAGADGVVTLWNLYNN